MNTTVIRRADILKKAAEETFCVETMLKKLEESFQGTDAETEPINTAETAEAADFEAALASIIDFDPLSVAGNASVGEDEEDYSDFFANSAKSYLLSVVEDIANDVRYVGEVFGVGDEESGCYYMLMKNEALESQCPVSGFTKVGLIVTPAVIDAIVHGKAEIEGYDFVGANVEGQWMFYRCNEKLSFMTTSTFGLVTNLFSRNTGLFEASEMLEKYAIIIGAGSVGSLIALQLARAGVRKFILIDGDILKLHNICRHQLGFKDLGRYKTSALKDAILNINPLAEVTTFNGYLQDAPLSLCDLDDNGIIVGTADNRCGNAVANDFAEHLHIPFVATGCWTRAAAGEVFYWKPESDLPTYREAFAELISDERPDAHGNYFGDETEEATLNFEPGTSVDIEFVTNVALKVCLDLLNLKSAGYTQRVLDYLTNCTLVCNTNNPAIGGENVTMFPHPLFISHTIRMRKEGPWDGENRSACCDCAEMGAN